MINAVIATEDRTFWTNDGIDLGAVFRAFLTNVTSGRIEQGGSTITQQLVKNRILTPKRDVNRKVKEIEDALRLNEKFSKKKILEEYLNTVYLGFELVRHQGRRGRASSSSATRVPRSAAGQDASTSSRSARPRSSPGSSRTPRATTPSAIPTVRSVAAPTCCGARWDRATSPRPRPTRPTTSRCRRCPRRRRPVREISSPPRCRTACSATPAWGTPRRSGSTSCYKGGLKIYTTFDPSLQRMAINATTNAKPQKGDDWASSLVSIDPSHRGGESHGLGSRASPTARQHRHLARRSPDRLHVQGDHPRHRIVQRLLAQRHRRRPEPLHGPRLRKDRR